MATNTQNVVPTSANETEAEARARRSLHVVGAVIVLITVAGVIWAVAGGSRWAHHRQLLAIQMGARADLELVADAEKQFRAKYGFYTTDLKALNLWPKRVLYAFGFVKPATFKEATGPEASSVASDLPQGSTVPTWDPEMRTIILLAEQRAKDAIAKAKADPSFKPDAPIVLSPMTKVAMVDFNRLISYCPDCTATKDSFKVIAAANLDDDPVLDVWTIDDKGKVDHLIDDLK